VWWFYLSKEKRKKMNNEMVTIFWIYNAFALMLFAAGVYCVVVTRSLIRALIGLEVMTKAATLLIIVGGYVTNNTAAAQALVITMIVLEVVVIVVAAGIVLNIYRHNDSLDIRKLRNLRG